MQQKCSCKTFDRPISEADVIRVKNSYVGFVNRQPTTGNKYQYLIGNKLIYPISIL